VSCLFGVDKKASAYEAEPFCVAQLNYSMTRSRARKEVIFFLNKSGLAAEIYNISEKQNPRTYIATIDESKIFHENFRSCKSISSMESRIKDVFIRNLSNMKISNIDIEQNVYLCESAKNL